MANGPDLNPFPGVIAFPIAINSAVSGPKIFDITTATTQAGIIQRPAFCFAKVLGPTPTTTYERTTMAATAINIAKAIGSNKTIKDCATITVAVNSDAFLTNKITFK